MHSKQLDKPTTTPDSKWASQAVADLIAGVNLNQRLVEAGIWDQLVVDMKTQADVDAYGIFLYGLRDSMRLAKKVRGD